MSNKTKFILIFSGGYLFTISMLFLLQISEIPWFFLWLVLMHGGIIILALSKSKFKTFKVLSHYRRTYLSLLLFIPILIYKIITRIFSLTENEEVIKIVSLAIILVCLTNLIYTVYKVKRQVDFWYKGWLKNHSFYLCQLFENNIMKWYCVL